MLKLVRYLRTEVNVESNVRDCLWSWDEKGIDRLKLERIDNFEKKIAAKKGRKGKKGEVSMPARVETITRDIVFIKDVTETINWIVEQRGMERKNTIVRTSIDGGRWKSEGPCPCFR